MSIVITTLLVSCLLPIVCSWISGYYRQQQFGAVDNKHPRQQAAALEGPGARAVAAQANAWEALAVFVAALVALVAAGADLTLISTACVVFLVARVLHLVCYMANQDILRSLSFLVSYGTCIYLFVLAYQAL